MNFKRLIGGIAIAGIVAASTLGIGAGIANANPHPSSPAQSSSETVAVQPVSWRGGGGYGFRHGGGYGFRHGGAYGYGFRPGFRGYWGHPWGWRR